MFEFEINDNLGVYKYYPGNDTLKIVDVLNFLNDRNLIINRHNVEELIYDYFQALENEKLLEFFKKYKQGDVLIIDDIHLLQSKENLNLLIKIIAIRLKENKKVFLAINWWESFDSGILDYIEKGLKTLY